MTKDYTHDLIAHAYHGIEDNIDADETVEVGLCDLLKVHATLAELISFFHQPTHYPSIEAVPEFLGTRDDPKGFSLLCKAQYDHMSRMLPERVQKMFDQGKFDAPEMAFYFEGKVSEQVSARNNSVLWRGS